MNEIWEAGKNQKALKACAWIAEEKKETKFIHPGVEKLKQKGEIEKKVSIF